MTRMWTLVLISHLARCHGEGFSFLKKRVCVIGAGRAGLAAIKLMADDSNHFDIVAFERNSDVGGLWIYRDDPTLDEHRLPAHSGIYKHLKSNIPKIMMLYPDYQYIKGEETLVYASHHLFLEYMRNYTRDFHLRQYIQFDTLITKVFPIIWDGEWVEKSWFVETQDLNKNEKNSTNCDAIVVCNGRFSKPYIPDISGIKTFPGKVLHSRSYRIPENFTNETVVVLGAGNSGIDISLDLSNHVKKVYLSHRHRTVHYRGLLPANIIVSSGIVSVNGSTFTLQDDSTIVADTLIYCTGYSYDFPFLDERSDIVFDKRKIYPLYRQLISVKHPSMAFIGFINSGNFASLYYRQMKSFMDLLQGRQPMPSYEEMMMHSSFP